MNWKNGLDLYNYPICDVVPVRVDWSSEKDLTSRVVNLGKTGKAEGFKVFFAGWIPRLGRSLGGRHGKVFLVLKGTSQLMFKLTGPLCISTSDES